MVSADLLGASAFEWESIVQTFPADWLQKLKEMQQSFADS